MTAAGAVIFPLVRSYTEHAGVPFEDAELAAELERGLAEAKPLSIALFVGASLFVRGAAPLLLLGKPSSFSSLSSDDREELLSRLQFSRSILIRALFLGLKPLLTGLCYRSVRPSEPVHA